MSLSRVMTLEDGGTLLLKTLYFAVVTSPSLACRIPGHGTRWRWGVLTSLSGVNCYFENYLLSPENTFCIKTGTSSIQTLELIVSSGLLPTNNNCTTNCRLPCPCPSPYPSQPPRRRFPTPMICSKTAINNTNASY